MVEILGTNVPLPSFSFGSVDLPSLVVIGVIFIFFIVGAIVIYFWYISRLYHKKIIVFENISGQGFQPTFKDSARLVSIGDGGEELLYLRKKKIYTTAYGKKMGKMEYWFAVGQDGYWYNCILGDLDAKMGMLDIEPIDRDQRYMSVAIRKNIESRYRKKTTEKVIAIAVGGLVLMSLILMIGGWYMFDKMAETSNTINEGVKLSLEVQESTRQIIASLDNVLSRGTGIS